MELVIRASTMLAGPRWTSAAPMTHQFAQGVAALHASMINRERKLTVAAMPRRPFVTPAPA